MKLTNISEAITDGVATYFQQAHDNSTGQGSGEYFVYEYKPGNGGNPLHLSKMLQAKSEELTGHSHSDTIHSWEGSWSDLDEVRATHQEEMEDFDRYITGKQYSIRDDHKGLAAMDKVLASGATVHLPDGTIINKQKTEETTMSPMESKIEKTFERATKQFATLHKAFSSQALNEAIAENGGDNIWLAQIAEQIEAVTKTIAMAQEQARPLAKPLNESAEAARIGRVLQIMAVKEPNDAIANAMANLSDYLEDYGTTFAAKSIADIEKKSGLTREVIMSLISRAKKYNMKEEAVAEETVAEAFDGPRVGRAMQAMAVKEPNDTISNAMANIADHLEDWGVAFGPKSMDDLVKKTGLDANIIKALIARASKKPAMEESALVEGILSTEDADGFMAKAQLYHLAKDAIESFQMIDDSDDLPPWMASKIAVASSSIQSVRRYAEYKDASMEAPEVEPMEEVSEETFLEGALAGAIRHVGAMKTQGLSKDEAMEKCKAYGIHPKVVSDLYGEDEINETLAKVKQQFAEGKG
jgi:fructose-specific component phosphotransferase system IIB-like protein